MHSYAEKREILRAHITKQGFHINDGIKYGLDYIVYTDHPRKVHSKYGVIIYRPMTHQQLVLYQRLCCSVNKHLVIAIVKGPDQIQLVRCERLEPPKDEGSADNSPILTRRFSGLTTKGASDWAKEETSTQSASKEDVAQRPFDA